MSYSSIDDFEDGVGNWVSKDSDVSFTQDTLSEQGSYSGYVSGTVSDKTGSYKLDVPTETPDKIRFEAQETSGNSGYYCYFYNSNGNLEIAAGSDNPQVSYFTEEDRSDLEQGIKLDYDTWTEITLDFDWGSNDVNIYWSDNNGNSDTSYKNIHGHNISSIHIGYRKTQNQNWYIDTLEWSGATQILSAPQNLNSTISQDDISLDWDEVTNATGYYVYRAESSGSTTSDYTQVADVTSPPYTDTALEDGERYYYRVSSHD